MIFDITDAAVAELKRIAELEKKEPRVRIAVKGGGCAGVTIDMSLTKWPADAEFDLVFSLGGIEVVVDAKSAAMLTGATLDYGGGVLDKKFSWRFPDNPQGCGCGKSFAL